jgi:hypothetical protein
MLGGEDAEAGAADGGGDAGAAAGAARDGFEHGAALLLVAGEARVQGPVRRVEVGVEVRKAERAVLETLSRSKTAPQRLVGNTRALALASPALARLVQPARIFISAEDI